MEEQTGSEPGGLGRADHEDEDAGFGGGGDQLLGALLAGARLDPVDCLGPEGLAGGLRDDVERCPSPPL